MSHAVSVVIPARNEASSLPALLRSLRTQTMAPAEIVVVDGGSTDTSAAEVRALAVADARLRLIEAGPATPGRGRNAGIAAAVHEWVALTDAGGWVEASWLRELVAAAGRHPDASVIFGNYEPVTDTFFTRCAALAYVPPKHDSADGLVRGPSTMSMLLRKDAWTLAGGFRDLRAGEDLIFMDALAGRGVRTAWAPAATARWRLQPSFAGTFRRFVVYSRHNVRAGLQRRWHYGLARQYAAAAGVAALAFAYDARLWLVVPGWLVLRTARHLWRRRGARGFGQRSWSPAQFAGVLAILLTIDAATWIGWAQALAGREDAA